MFWFGWEEETMDDDCECEGNQSDEESIGELLFLFLVSFIWGYETIPKSDSFVVGFREINEQWIE